MNRRFEDAGIFKILKLWPIFLGVATVLISIGALKGEIESNRNRLIQNEECHVIFDERIRRLEIIIAQFPELKQDLKEILKELRKK